MNFDEFKIQFENELKAIDIDLTEKQYLQFFDYMNLLIEWNEKINLTTIVKPCEIISKHFIDSLTIMSYFKDDEKVIDVGTGAGFPGIPLKIANPTLKITLLDSLNKRLKFLNEVIERLNLKEIETIHYRAEEAGININYRGKYDKAVSRAVAPLNILLEYTIPFVKVTGKCIYMKSNKTDEEVIRASNAFKELYSIIYEKKEFNLPFTDINRSILIVEKEREISKKYPRKAGIPSKLPL